mgnify:CR=1 FL=1
MNAQYIRQQNEEEHSAQPVTGKIDFLLSLYITMIL